MIAIALIIAVWLAIRVRRLRIDRDRISTELDAAYQAAAALAADRLLPASWDRTDAEDLITTIESDLADTTLDLHTPREYQAGWNAALREYGAPMIEMLRSAVAELDNLEIELRAVTDDRDAITVVANAATGAGLKLGHQVNQRDAAIEALTRRVAELMPCADRGAFVDGALDRERADAFRAHLRGCPVCRQALPEDVALVAHLSTLPPEPRP